MKIEWHPEAVADLTRLDTATQLRIKKALDELRPLDDARVRLVPYAATLKGFWKLRVGDYRLVCQITQRDGQTVLIIYVAHRSVAYGARGVRTVRNRDR